MNFCHFIGVVLDSDARIAEQSPPSIHFTLSVPRRTAGKAYTRDRIPVQCTGRTAGSEYIREGSVIEVRAHAVVWLKGGEDRCLFRAEEIVPVPGKGD